MEAALFGLLLGAGFVYLIWYHADRQGHWKQRHRHNPCGYVTEWSSDTNLCPRCGTTDRENWTTAICRRKFLGGWEWKP